MMGIVFTSGTIGAFVGLGVAFVGSGVGLRLGGGDRGFVIGILFNPRVGALVGGSVEGFRDGCLVGLRVGWRVGWENETKD